MNPVTEVKTNPNAAPELAVVNGGAAVAEAPQKLAAIAGPEARLGDRRFFADQTFHFEAPRALGYTGGAEAGEVLDTVGHTTKGMSRAGTLHGQRPQTALAATAVTPLPHPYYYDCLSVSSQYSRFINIWS